MAAVVDVKSVSVIGYIGCLRVVFLPQCITTVIGVILNKVFNSPQILFTDLVDLKMCFEFAMGIHVVNGL